MPCFLAHKFDTKTAASPKIWALGCSIEVIYNIGVVIEAEVESDELDPLLYLSKWQEFFSKANMVVAKKNSVNVERSANRCSAEILFDAWKYSVNTSKTITLLNLNISWKPHNYGKVRQSRRVLMLHQKPWECQSMYGLHVTTIH